MARSSSKIIHFGEHLTIDGYLGNFKKLNDKKLILKCLNQLPTLVRMKKLGRPQIYKAAAGGNKDPGGWSGFVIIAESHISIHSFPLRRFVSIDVYTCKNGLKKNFIIKYFKKTFGLRKTEIYFIKRGKNYPKFNII
jgi:S-adenosylmethionine decarboxylase